VAGARGMDTIVAGFAHQSTYTRHQYPVRGVAVNRTNGTFLSLDEQGLRVWRSAGGGDVKRVTFPAAERGFISRVIYVPSLRLYFAAALDMCIQVFDFEFNLKQVVPSYQRSILCLSFDASSQELISAGIDGVKIWCESLHPSLLACRTPSIVPGRWNQPDQPSSDAGMALQRADDAHITTVLCAYCGRTFVPSKLKSIRKSSGKVSSEYLCLQERLRISDFSQAHGRARPSTQVVAALQEADIVAAVRRKYLGGKEDGEDGGAAAEHSSGTGGSGELLEAATADLGAGGDDVLTQAEKHGTLAWVFEVCRFDRLLFVVTGEAVVVVDVNTGDWVDTWDRLHEQIVTSLQFFEPREYLITASNDCTIKVWTVNSNLKQASTNTRRSPAGEETVSLVAMLTTHTGAVKQVVLHPNNEKELLLSCSHDCTVRVFHLGTMDQLFRLDLNSPVSDVSVDSGEQVAVCSGNEVSVWTFKPVLQLFAKCSGVTQLVRLREPRADTPAEQLPSTAARQQTSQCLAVASAHSVVLMSSTGRGVCTVIPHRGADDVTEVVDICFDSHSDKAYVLVTSGAVWVYTMPRSGFHPQDIASDDTWNHTADLACGCMAQTVCTSSIAADNREGAAVPMNATSQTKVLPMGTADGKLVLLDLQNDGRVWRTQQCHRLGVTHVKWLPSTAHVVTLAVDECCVWEGAALTLCRRIDLLQSQQVRHAFISSDGNIVQCKRDHTVWTAAAIDATRTGAIEPVVGAFADHTVSIDYHATLHIFMTVSAAGTVNVFDDSWHLLRTFKCCRVVECGCFLNQKGDIVLSTGTTLSLLKSDGVFKRVEAENTQAQEKSEEQLAFDAAVLALAETPAPFPSPRQQYYFAAPPSRSPWSPRGIPPPEHTYLDRNSELTEIYLRC
jgi:WD40 repeat protein